MQTKTFSSVTIKDADQGIIEAVFASRLVDSIKDATADDIDLGGDVTLKGAFDEGAAVVISAYGHGSWGAGVGMGGSVPQLPVGKGFIHEIDGEAVLKGQFFLDTTHGRDAWLTIKSLSEDDLQEWSYSLQGVKAQRGTVGGRRVRFIEHVGVKEVSPTLVGEGIDTRTIGVKSATTKAFNSQSVDELNEAGQERWAAENTYIWLRDFDPDAGVAIFSIYTDGQPDRLIQVDYTTDGDIVQLGATETDVEVVTNYAPKSGARFSEHVKSVMAGIDDLATRAQEVVALRALKGKSISEDSADLLTQVTERLDALKALIGEPPETITPVDELQRIALRQIASAQGVHIS